MTFRSVNCSSGWTVV